MKIIDATMLKNISAGMTPITPVPIVGTKKITDYLIKLFNS